MAQQCSTVGDICDPVCDSIAAEATLHRAPGWEVTQPSLPGKHFTTAPARTATQAFWPKTRNSTSNRRDLSQHPPHHNHQQQDNNRSATSATATLRYLVLREGDEGAHDHADAIGKNRRQLIAEGLPTSGGHHHQGVVASRHLPHRFLCSRIGKRSMIGSFRWFHFVSYSFGFAFGLAREQIGTATARGPNL